MTISYKWLCEYLPEKIEPERLSRILTSIGLEVESLEKYEEIRGGLQGLLIGEVLECSKHPGADKLSLTKVDIGNGEPLRIVCGAPNVAAGQKVIVATAGTTIYPTEGASFTIKKAKIRGEESNGMLCAEDEIGLGSSHDGILILPQSTAIGTPAAEYFGTYTDHIFEIGLTPNRMDAMSHIGVARDICAYLNHHENKGAAVKLPFSNDFTPDNHNLPISVTIENTVACQRYSGVSLEGVTVTDSPKWLQQKLRSIGLRPINNIVDITNFILHETGQPLHAFDADRITGGKVVVKNFQEGTSFISLDAKERKLSAEDLLIANASEPMCIAGVYGGLNSGVTAATKNIFLESAWFNPSGIRKTSFHHGLRTDAAGRFEKGVDISNTVNVLKRAALMIKEIAGGEIASDLVDVYPDPQPKVRAEISYDYLEKLSGKNYEREAVKNILTGLGFETVQETQDMLAVAIPYSKPDISIAADIVEEIMRIDGLDNIEIPSAIKLSPARETLGHKADCKEKIVAYLTGTGFREIFTNSITNSAYYDDKVLNTSVKMINSLSAELDVLRPSLIETGLETVAYNCNRKSNDLLLFEFGKIYSATGEGKYREQQRLGLYITGKTITDGWKLKAAKTDIYFAKGIAEKILTLLGIKKAVYRTDENKNLNDCLMLQVKNEEILKLGSVTKSKLAQFDIKQAVFFIDIDWDKLVAMHEQQQITFAEIAKFPAVHRDLSIVVDKKIQYAQVEKATEVAALDKLQSMNLFDVFENEKLGAGKKSMAVSFTFLDEEKTMTDKEIDEMMRRIIVCYEKELNAGIRK